MYRNIHRSDLGSGAATPFNPNIIYIDSEKLINCPEPDENGVVVDGDIVVDGGANSFYVTASTLKVNEDSVGDIDSEGNEIKVEATMPGDNQTTKEFKVWAQKRSFIILFQTCKGGEYQMLGDCCNPMRLAFGTERDKDKTVTKISMKRPQNTDEPIKIYRGNVSFAEPLLVTSNDLVVTSSPTNQYALSESLTGTLNLVDVAILKHGSVISLIGKGGNSPIKLENSTVVKLKDGTTWEALNGSVISLKAFDDGTNVTLFEINRK